MAKYCIRCGNAGGDDALFCTECGQRLEQTPAVLPTAAALPTKEKCRTSTATFFGMLVLFSVPILGWLVCAVSCFAAKRRAVKRFARAFFLWTLAALAVLAVCVAALALHGDAARAAADRLFDALSGVKAQLYTLLERLKPAG